MFFVRSRSCKIIWLNIWKASVKFSGFVHIDRYQISNIINLNSNFVYKKNYFEFSWDISNLLAARILMCEYRKVFSSYRADYYHQLIFFECCIIYRAHENKKKRRKTKKEKFWYKKKWWKENHENWENFLTRQKKKTVRKYFQKKGKLGKTLRKLSLSFELEFAVSEVRKFNLLSWW